MITQKAISTILNDTTMRNTIFICALLSIIFFACSKKDAEPGKTYVTVINRLDYDIENVVLGYTDSASNKGVLIQNAGTLAKGASSNKIEITNSKLTELYICFDFTGRTYIITTTFPFTKGQSNELAIVANVFSFEIEKSSTLYPK